MTAVRRVCIIVYSVVCCWVCLAFKHGMYKVCVLANDGGPDCERDHDHIVNSPLFATHCRVCDF